MRAASWPPTPLGMESGYVLEVGVLEQCGVLQAEPEEAVQGDVGGPDERQLDGERVVLDVAGEQECEWEG